MYEALRAYFVEDRSSAETAKAFGYTPGSFRVLCHQFRRDDNPAFFVKPLRGPRSQPKKTAARDLIVQLRKQNHSVYEISTELKRRHMLLSPTAVREVLKEEGFAPLPRRLDEERPDRVGPTVEPVADVRSLSLTPRSVTTGCGGLFLFVPDLIRLGLDQLARAAHLPGSRMIPAEHALRACLALKLWCIKRRSHVMAKVADEGLALFAGLNAIPKKSFLSEYSSRVDPAKNSRLTTYPNLARLEKMGITFITLRRRTAKLLQEVAALPRSAWRTIELDVPTRKYKTPRIYEQTVALAGATFRQIFIRDLGHDEPTLLLTNDRRTSATKLITRYAQRMLIENALSDAVRFFHMDALSSAVGLKIDFDMTLLVIASGLYRLMARRMRGYADAQARQLFRDLIDTPATVTVTDKEIVVAFHRRAHLPIILASGLLDQPVTVPWWSGRALRLTT